MTNRRLSESTGVTGGTLTWASSIQIGEALWRARLRMDLTLEDIACRTGIEVQTISAIENSNFDQMRSHDAIVAAARAYARTVGVSEWWVAQTLARILKEISLMGVDEVPV